MEQMIMFAVFIGIGVALFVVFQKRAKQTVAAMAAAGPQIEAAYRTVPIAGESAPRIVAAYEGTGVLRKNVMIGVTDKRAFLAGLTPEPLVISLDAAVIHLTKKTFEDSGNTMTTYTEGWEATVEAGGQKHTWRLHPMTGAADEAANLEFLLAQLGSRAVA